MTLNKFLLLLLSVYGAYYFFLFILDYIRGKARHNMQSGGESIHYEVPPAPVNVLKMAEGERSTEDSWGDNSGGGIGKKKEATPERTSHSANQTDSAEEGYKNLGVDLGLEAASLQGIEVTHGNIKTLLKP